MSKAEEMKTLAQAVTAPLAIDNEHRDTAVELEYARLLSEIQRASAGRVSL